MAVDLAGKRLIHIDDDRLPETVWITGYVGVPVGPIRGGEMSWSPLG